MCVGFSPPGARKEDYLKMRPDFSNVGGQRAMSDLFMPSDQWIDLTKEDVFTQNISVDGFVAPDAGWLYVRVTNILRGGYLDMIVQQDGMRVSMGRDASQQGTNTTDFMRMIPVQKGQQCGYTVTANSVSTHTFVEARFYYAKGTAP